MSGHDERDDSDDEPWKGRLESERLVKETADLMWSLGLFQMGASLLTVLVAVSSGIDHLVKGLQMRPEQVATAVGVVALGAVGALVGGVVVRGAVALRRLQGYSKAKSAAVLTALSLPCVAAAPFSVPLGIWALLLLRRPDVRRQFDLSERPVRRPS